MLTDILRRSADGGGLDELIGPTTIGTSINENASAVHRKMDRCQNGILWALFWDGTQNATSMKLYYSVNDGITWTLGSQFGLATGGNVPYSSFFIDIDDYAHVVHKNTSNGYITYLRGTPNAERTSYTWNKLSSFTTNLNESYPDIVVHREGTGWRAHIVVSYSTASQAFVKYYPITITSGGGITVGGSTGVSVSYATSVSREVYPSIDFNHIGDGKTIAGGTPHLYVAWSAANTAGAGFGTRFKKATYLDGSWTWGTEREIDSSRYVLSAAYPLTLFFDGIRVVITGLLYTGSVFSYVIHDRDVADTTTTLRAVLVNPGAVERLVSSSASYDSVGNVYMFGANADKANGTQNLVYRKWTRSGGILGPQILFDDTGRSVPYLSAKRGFSNNRIDFLYIDNTSSPFNIRAGGIK